MEDLEVKTEEVTEVKEQEKVSGENKKAGLGFLAGSALVVGTIALYKKVLKPAAIVVKNKLFTKKSKTAPETTEAESADEKESV